MCLFLILLPNKTTHEVLETYAHASLEMGLELGHIYKKIRIKDVFGHTSLNTIFKLYINRLRVVQVFYRYAIVFSQFIYFKTTDNTYIISIIAAVSPFTNSYILIPPLFKQFNGCCNKTQI